MSMKKDRYERYIERDDLQDATHLEVSVSYNLGGANYFSGGTIRRGFYLNVKPVTKGRGMVSYTLFSGKGRLLFETQRFTAKQFAKAVEMAKEFEEELIADVVAKSKKSA